MSIQWIVLFIISTFSLAGAQDINYLIEKIYQANITQERELDALKNYKFKQKINSDISFYDYAFNLEFDEGIFMKDGSP